MNLAIGIHLMLFLGQQIVLQSSYTRGFYDEFDIDRGR